MTQLSVPAVAGEPDESTPEFAARLGLVPAAPGIRSLAFAIDVAIWLVLATPLVIGAIMLATGADVVLSIVLMASGWLLTVLFGLIQLLTHGRRGVTAGKAAMRLRSVSVIDYGRPGFWRVVLRALVLWLGFLIPVVGPALLFASGLWDPQSRGRSILDRVGRCWVIDCRAGLDPFDAKAVRQARRDMRVRVDDTEELPSMATGVDASTALRIPGARSRAGVVGPGSTGAQWAEASAAATLIDGVPGADAAPAAFAGPIASPAVASPAAPYAPDAVVSAVAGPTTVPAAPAPALAPAPVAPVPAQPVPSQAAPAPAAAEPAQPVTRRAQAMLRFDDGSIVRVPALALIGRDPEAADGEAVEALVRLEDPERLMSKTHAAFGQDAQGVWVTDRGSRNGTQLQSPGGDTVDVPVGERMRMPLGWTARVGGRSFELVARGADS